MLNLVFLLLCVFNAEAFVTIVAFTSFWAILAISRYKLRGVRNNCPDAVNEERTMPLVSVVMPIKGFNPEKLNFWRAQTSTSYQNVEFVFVTESKNDPATEHIEDFLREFYANRSPSDSRHIECKQVISGLSWHNAQKIHNMIAGTQASNPDSRYTLFLDDDLGTNPNTIEILVRAIEEGMANPDDEDEKPKNWISTGYIVEVPPPETKSTLMSHFLSLYRIINLSSFANKYCPFAWGGCFMIRTADLRANRHGILDIWRDGGYSDDMAVSNIAHQTGKRIVADPRVLFRGDLRVVEPVKKTFNFVQRQFVTLDTYFTRADWLQNRLQVTLAALALPVILIPTLSVIAQLASIGPWAVWSLYQYVSDRTPPSPYLALDALMLTLILIAAYLAIVVNKWTLTVLVDVVAGQQGKERGEPFMFKKWGFVAGAIIYMVAAPTFAVSTVAKRTVDWYGVLYSKQGGRIVRCARHPDDMRRLGELADDEELHPFAQHAEDARTEPRAEMAGRTYVVEPETRKNRGWLSRDREASLAAAVKDNSELGGQKTCVLMLNPTTDGVRARVTEVRQVDQI
ncbi:Ceramide glucosyltransferase [Carpediemonas membranifera]|uniref:ceramide glucosyltransferase n=1 Tax=Carpediemonas membranifera TaxID=201153 RepID=A0A8J6B799_9EUKA|nr:Ceramide glucosyltransferase [Carpediemonas membranifera]|eukprot:KAG9394247.1 Ceramide glucosyltransferase [Carpediemonas membranifera]